MFLFLIDRVLWKNLPVVDGSLNCLRLEIDELTASPVETKTKVNSCCFKLTPNFRIERQIIVHKLYIIGMNLSYFHIQL